MFKKRIVGYYLTMWNDLPVAEREEYKRMILAFASLTEMFAQKADFENERIPYVPVINSKYQETVFQRVFHASAEDIGNTSYDAAICHKNADGTETKYLVGIKTFGIASGEQKIAQFKANHNEWSEIINQIKNNSKGKNKDEIDSVNRDLYCRLALNIAELRNKRIASSEAQLQGFTVSLETEDVQAVYHVLMPSKKGEKPAIYVGETPYNRIDLKNIKVTGCTSDKNPTNFDFTDGKHRYRFTAADSQLLMDFENKKIIKEEWEVVYAEDAYSIFSGLADKIVAKTKTNITESHSWFITNDNGEVERYSGFNNFFGLGSKISIAEREKRIKSLYKKYSKILPEEILERILNATKHFVLTFASKQEEKKEKEALRKAIISELKSVDNDDFKSEIYKLIFRPVDELYIPIPNSKRFHEEFTDFFGKGFGKLDSNGKLVLAEKERRFNLVFEPSGDKVKGHITQDFGKGLASAEKQSILGEWILKKVFQLEDYEPLTRKRLNEIGINALRLYKISGSDDIHIEFIWINKDNKPNDFFC